MQTLRLLPVMFVALCATTVFAQKTTLQLQDASGDRLVIETGTLTANRTTTLPDASGMLMVSGTAGLDDLLDAMSNGTNFIGSVLLGNQITPSVNAGFNTGVGADVFSNALTGSENVAVGRLAGSDLTSGSRNVLIGGAAGAGITTGNNNTMLGNLAGRSLTTGSNNVFLGYGAGFNETGSNKLYIDNSSTSTPLIYGDFGSDYVTINGTMRIADPTRDNYTAFAAQEQAANITYTLPATAPTTGQALIAGPTPTTLVWGAGGAEKIDDLTDAKSGGANFTNSLVLGHQNLGAINGADQNTGVGFGVIQNVSTGDYNTAFGYTAMQSVTTGEQNTAIGSLAMNRLTTGSANVAIGMYAMFDATTSGNNNTIVGTQAGFEVDGTAAENTAVGARIFRNPTTGNQNTVLGADAMYNGGTGSNNTVLGYSAFSGATTGSNNVIIGSQAGLLLQTGSGNVFLGHNAGWSETGSDKLYIDNSSTGAPLIYGDFSSNNLTVNGALTLMAATSDFNTSNVDAANLTQTYIAFGQAGAGNDWSYLRQIGSLDNYHVAWDFHDNGNDARFSIRDVNSSSGADLITTRFSLDGSGNLTASGYGTFKSHVILQPSSATEGGELRLLKASNDTRWWVIDQFEGDNEPRLRLFPTFGWETLGLTIEEDDGHVGIGTNNPTTRLELVSGGAFVVGSTPRSNDAATISIRNSNNTDAAAHAMLAISSAGSGGGDPFISWDVTSAAGWSMGMDNSDADKLKLFGNWDMSGTVFLTFDDDNDRIGFWDETPDYPIDIWTNTQYSMCLSSTTTDAQGMLVMNIENANANVQEFILFQTYNISRGIISYDPGSGNMYFGNASDYRLKSDFKPFNALSLVDRIPVYDYEWKASGARVYGFIAHELQEVVPYLVIGQKDAVDDQGKPIYQMVDYSKLTPILTKAIQEQQAIIESQEQRIKKLEALVEQLLERK